MLCLHGEPVAVVHSLLSSGPAPPQLFLSDHALKPPGSHISRLALPSLFQWWQITVRM